jgi:hypothetical protein
MTHKWKYWDSFEPKDYFGFVYKITNLKTGRFYIGKKSFYHNKKHKITKKQLAEQPIKRGRKSAYEIIQVESDWKIYWGSNKQLLADIKELGEDKFDCTILKLCKTKKQLTYWEMHHQCINHCIVSYDLSYNDNILGRFFSKDLA